jgi:trans-aconitate methyltransferase
MLAALLAIGTGGCAGELRITPPPSDTAGEGVFFTAGVPYVPTRPEVMDAMLALAEVRSTDTVYDLGCGDGRIVLAAASRFGARGLGVDLDGDLIARAQAQAQWQGLTDRTRFSAQDLFELDLRPATVLMLYLSVEINLKLRPRMLAELRPGSRIVSNRFDMADVWRPERTIEVVGTPVHLWRVPPRA